MARELVVHLTALSAVLSFFYISQSLERHSLTESPRLSSFLVLLLSGSIFYVASCFTKWLPGADGRFKRGLQQPLDDEPLVKGPNGHTPKRPRRWSLPALVLCIVLRFEIFHRVDYQQQCSTPGVESFLCILLFAYEIFSTRRKWGFPPAEDPDDPWRSFFDDLQDWFTGPRVVLTFSVASALMFSTGTYYAIGQITRSTYFCFEPFESRRTTLSLQLLGLVLDATIVVLLWRMLAWSRTTKLRLRTLGTVLILSSLSMSFVWVGSRLFQGPRGLHAGFGFLYGFDIVVDSFAFALLMVSAAFWVCETSPLTPVSIMTFLVGTFRASVNIISFGDWLHTSRAAGLVPLWFIASGMVLFTYCQELRSVIFIRRFYLVFLLSALLLAATIFTFVKQPQTFVSRHPVNDLIYKAHVKQDAWLRHATISNSLSVAVDEYKERHDGRNPPPNFSDWYEFAKDTLVIDQFDRIDRDLRPFWGVSPKSLRERAVVMTAAPGVQTVTIKNGEASHNAAGGSEAAEELESLVAMINRFAKSLPDMVLPINLSPTPRILPSWEEANRQNRADLSYIVDLMSKRSLDVSNATAETTSDGEDAAGSIGPAWTFTSAADYRQMQVEACAPLSRTRTNPHWNVGEFCSACVRRHSKGQLLTRWDRSLEFCSQPDIKYLHGISLTNPRLPPIRELLPLFGPSKTEPFSDIMIPLPGKGNEKSDLPWKFNRRYDTLFWRGKVGDHAISDEALRGSHKFRLLHLINNPNSKDEVTMILPIPGDPERPKDPDRYRHERVPAAKANSVVPFSVGISNYSACLGQNCELVEAAYGARDQVQEPLEYRYVLLLDEDDGPPAQMLRTLRSLSVPFVSSIFQSWYTERLMPWMHFVPIDVRYQGLHTIYTYFTGTEDRGPINGRETGIKARVQDAEWIGQQGRRWAEAALGERDMEAYLFRLLLEWGRLVDEKRDEIGFSRDEAGEFHGDGWTPPPLA
ncbi:hypothetical protein G7046_g7041 [Stylonectria norvegica]|nr:hypothetical protein G7046_g7041 [Stylonectria norvegica]